MSGLLRTTLIECPRSQSEERQGNNNQNPSQWTNRVGNGLHLKPGDKISVHSSYISEIGAQAGQIQIKGQSLNASVEVEITEYDEKLYQDDLPSKYTLVNASNVKKIIEIRDDTLNLIVSPYKTANGEYYAHLPRRWIGDGNNSFWGTYHSRDKTPVDGDIGQTILPPPPLNRCSSDINIKYWAYRSGSAHTRHRVDGINDGSRYTIFTRKETFMGSPDTPLVSVIGQAKAGSPIIELTHGSTAQDLIVGMELITQSPDIVFLSTPIYSSILTINGLEITMDTNASANTTSHNTFTFQVPSTSSASWLPPTTVSGSYSAAAAESLRDPALWGDYIQVKNLISVKANAGYNSPTDLADQLTQEINERTDLVQYDYDTTDNSSTYVKRETFTTKTETPAYKVYNCAKASDYSKSDYADWIKTDGSWNTDHAYHYLSSYRNIGIKRPELYQAGIELIPPNASGPWYEGFTGEKNGKLISPYYPVSTLSEVLTTDIPWTEANLLRFKKFFDAQVIYPELFDYTQSNVKCEAETTRFFHMNLYDNANGSLNIQGAFTAHMNYGSYIRDAKAPQLGYDLYNASVSSSMTSFPIFVDFNPATESSTLNDVAYTDYGPYYLDDDTYANYDDLAYGFARKVRIKNWDTGVYSYVLGFQFTRTSGKIPTHFFQFNASAAAQALPEYTIGAGLGRNFGFDFHFTAYGTAGMILYNGNSTERGAAYNTGGTVIYEKLYTFAQATNDRLYELDNYQFGMYLGAESPVINYDTAQQRFQLQLFHTPEVVGNLEDADYIRPTGSSPSDPNAGDPCYKINKRPLKWNYTPELAPYLDSFSGSYTSGSNNAYVSHNVGIEPYKIMDAQSGLFIEDWVVPEQYWNESLIGIMGFRYNQFHNPDSSSSRQVRLKATGANADLHNVNIITTNAIVSEGDLSQYQMNTMDVSMYSPVLPVATMPSGPGFKPGGRYITPAITVSPVDSVNITAERLPSITLRPYYTIRSDIISEPNHILGGATSGITLPIVAITNKANPYGDFINGFQGQITFTNTIDRVLTKIRCSIHDPDGSAARCDLNSAVIFRIYQNYNADMNIVGELLESKKKSDQLLGQEIEDPQLEFQNVKYIAKDLFQ